MVGLSAVVTCVRGKVLNLVGMFEETMVVGGAKVVFLYYAISIACGLDGCWIAR